MSRYFVVPVLIALLAFPSAPLRSQTEAIKADVSIADQVYPYALMSQDAYSDSGNLSGAGVRRMPFDWEAVLRRNGYSDDRINSLKSSGFSAALYRNDQTKELTVAFRGSEGWKDYADGNIPARLRLYNLQYEAAPQLVAAVKKTWPAGTTISLTGHSLGGGLASYVGSQYPDITRIVTFNGARNSSSQSGSKPSQINIYVRDDIVGSPDKNGPVGSKTLPGRSFYVDSTTELLTRGQWDNSRRIIPDVITTHSMEGIVGGLKAIKENTSVASPAVVERKPNDGPFNQNWTGPKLESNVATPAAPQGSKIATPSAPLAAPMRPESTDSGINTHVSQSTPAIGLTKVDEAALRNARYIAEKLRAVNDAGIASVKTDPDFKKAIADLRDYVRVAGSTYIKATLAGHDPVTSMVIAGVAGDLQQYRKEFNEAVRAYRTNQLPELATTKSSEWVGEQLAKAFFKKAAGATIPYTPTVAKDAAMVGARFIMAYENGVIDKLAPQGLRPLLNKNGTTASWLQHIDSALAASAKTGPSAAAPAQPSQPAASGATPGKSIDRPSIEHVAAATPAPTRAAPGTLSSPPATPRGATGPIVGTAPGAQIALSGGGPLRSPSTFSAPGGISISKAAAARLPLDIDLDGAYAGEGKIVLSGRDARPVIDAALFLTTLRAACQQEDPYFSLDPDGAEWNSQGEEASNEMWSRLKAGLQPNLSAKRHRRPGALLDVRTISARRDHANLWREIAQRYPNFRSKLVFHPQWLAETRLGEILYKADVLLKELSSGVSVLTPGPLRASAIAGYLAADAERAAKKLLDDPGTPSRSTSQWRGSRLWFDLAPPPSLTSAIAFDAATQSPDKPEIRSLLAARGLIRARTGAPLTVAAIVRDGDSIDLSSVNPRMFVRVHDHATRRDLSDHDPDLDGLASDVTKRFDQYAQVYDELRMLREVFRSYVVAIHVVERNARLCRRLDALPLMDAEKVAAPLPDFHSSELFITVANYTTTSKTMRRGLSAVASSLNGGVSIAGRQVFETAARDGRTLITQEIRKVGESDAPAEPAAGRRFVMLTLDEEPVRLVSTAPPGAAPTGDRATPAAAPVIEPRATVVPGEEIPAANEDDEIENAPVPKALPKQAQFWPSSAKPAPAGQPQTQRTSSPGNGSNEIIWLVGGLVLIALFAFSRRRVPR